jgi:hypothetical protein
MYFDRAGARQAGDLSHDRGRGSSLVGGRAGNGGNDKLVVAEIIGLLIEA